MEKLLKSGGIKKGIKNLPDRRCFVEEKEVSPIVEASEREETLSDSSNRSFNPAKTAVFLNIGSGTKVGSSDSLITPKGYHRPKALSLFGQVQSDKSIQPNSKLMRTLNPKLL